MNEQPIEGSTPFAHFWVSNERQESLETNSDNTMHCIEIGKGEGRKFVYVSKALYTEYGHEVITTVLSNHLSKYSGPQLVQLPLTNHLKNRFKHEYKNRGAGTKDTTANALELQKNRNKRPYNTAKEKLTKTANENFIRRS